ncbi:hypothetical protein BU16DRAFT_535529 [Lophium mytilinum]|uniref:Uncharacterized protein n=1 Tax=Lophium mytilinum TaxID=390894 RepID=A0A6A6R5X4_9PEZI|nr:hypothetical protein BU16DRAFT_535529 [Lophium mytilinum]
MSSSTGTGKPMEEHLAAAAGEQLQAEDNAHALAGWMEGLALRPKEPPKPRKLKTMAKTRVVLRGARFRPREEREEKKAEEEKKEKGEKKEPKRGRYGEKKRRALKLHRRNEAQRKREEGEEGQERGEDQEGQEGKEATAVVEKGAKLSN